MPRKHDISIKILDSWYDDILDPVKEFSSAEVVQIFQAIRTSQREGNAEVLLQLPLSIRRGLSMATMVEQTQRIIEKRQSCKERATTAASGRWSGTESRDEAKARKIDQWHRRNEAMRAFKQWVLIIDDGKKSGVYKVDVPADVMAKYVELEKSGKLVEIRNTDY